MERLGGTIGYILGAIFIVPLVFLLINKYSINRNDFGLYKKKYLSNTIELDITIENYEIDQLSNGYPSLTKAFTTNMASAGGRDKSSRSAMFFRKIYDKKTHKYFLINVIDGDRSVFSAINRQRFSARINAEEFESKYYGDLESLIPVFCVRGTDKPLQFYNRKGDMVQLDISEEQYAYSAEMYWTYVATKEEFERRFGKQK